ncbi:MAG: hypothetical protein WBB21_04080 [Saprospiraceae bacterium]
MVLNKVYFCFFLISFYFSQSFAQQLNGRILNTMNQKPISLAVINEQNSGQIVYSDADGNFSLDPLKINNLMNLQVSFEGFELFSIELKESDWNPIMQEFFLYPATISDYKLVEFSGTSSEDENSESDVYSLLSSADDPILEAASFQFSLFRYRLKGIEQNYEQLGLNGFLLNDPISGRLPYYLFSGQNLITKYSEVYRNFKENPFDYGSSGVAQWVNANPAAFKNEFFVRYAISNRAYNHKLDLNYATGELANGWSFLIGANRRWAQEAFIPGSFYDAWGAYLGISKRIAKNHNFQLLVMGAPSRRGKASPATKEVYALAGDNYYNSYWGFQQGEKRNSREANYSTPMALLNYSWDVKENLKFTSGIMGLTGKRSDSQLDWFNAPDPRPDYYQKLPSYIQDSTVSNAVVAAWKNDVNTRQIDWNQLYFANYGNIETIQGVNGNPTATVTGKRSVYWLRDKHFDPTELEHFGNLKWFNKRNEFIAGYRMEFSKTEFYLKARDLLGGDFFVDLEDFADLPSQQHPDISQINHIVKKDEIYGYHYEAKNQNFNFFGNYIYTGKFIDLSFGANYTANSFSRNGKFQNAIFNNSLGESDRVHQNGVGGKGFITLKLNGRNYIRTNLALQKLPNRFDQVFINPEWRADQLQITDKTTVQYIDLSYFYRSPEFKFEISPYYATYKDQIVNRNFFLDEQLESAENIELTDGGLISAFYTGLNQRHIGFETSFELKLGRGFEVSGVYNVGDHIYTSRPELIIFDKFSQSNSQHTIYLKNFYVPGSALQAACLNLKYDFKRNGFAVLSANFVSDQYLEPNPLRRIPQAVKELDPESDQFNKIINQEKLPSVVYLNAFVYKSFEIFKERFAISLSVNNVLNKKGIVSGGFEQYRFDYQDKNPDKFPSKYYYLQGFNYYLGVSWKYDFKK